VIPNQARKTLHSTSQRQKTKQERGTHLKGISNASIVGRKGTLPTTAAVLEEPNKGNNPPRDAHPG